MKVVLIKPPTGGIYKEMKSVTPESPPLGLAYIAAVLLENNHDVKILDLAVEGMSKEQLNVFIKNYSPDLIGLTSTTPTIEAAYKITDDLKSEFQNTPIVIGGPHATALPEEILQHADFAVKGEGEYTTLELANELEKSNPDLKKINGLSFKEKKSLTSKEKKITHNQLRPLIENLNNLPFPARHLLPLKKYHYLGAKKHPLSNIFTSRGCPFGCVYCNKNIFGRTFRVRTPENVLEEIELLINDFKIKEIHFSDDAFTTIKKRAAGICDQIIQKKFDLALCPNNGIRVDSIDFELMGLMKKAGFYAMMFGVESGDQQILNNIKKGITIQQVEDAFRLAKKLKFETWGFFMFGLPGETKQTAQKTIDFAIKLEPDIAKFHILVPYPGTGVYNMFKDRIKIKKWSDYTLYSGATFTPENMTIEELEAIHKRAYKQFFFRPTPIYKTLKRIILTPSRLKETFKAGLAVSKMSK